MSRSHLFLTSFAIVAFLGIASADYNAGRSLKPYETNNNDYRAGRSLKPYQPYVPNNYDYKSGRSLKPYTPYNNNDYKVGRSLKPYTPSNNNDYKAGRSLKPYQSYENGYKTGHSLKPYQPNNDYGYKAGRSLRPYQPQEKYPATNIKIQGLIYCKRNGQLIPMQGANARVTCEVKHKNGYETAHISHISVDTPVTDKKGYFLINLGKYFSHKYTFNNCKVFLDEAAHGDHCNIPTNVNNGKYGATPAKPRRLSGNYVLYSVGPFAFVPASY